MPSGFEGRDVVGELVAVERQAGLEAQRVAAAEPAGLHAAFDQLVPEVAYRLSVGIDLKSVLARVACAADYHVADGLERVEAEIGAIDAEDVADDLFGLRTLNRDLGPTVALVVNGDVKSLGVAFDPCDVLVDVGCVDDEEEVVIGAFVDEEIVDDAAVGMEHHAVDDFSVGQPADIVGEDMVDKAFGVRPADGNLAHVRDIEDSAAGAHGFVLFFDAGILDRHVEAAERAHQGAEPDVQIVETCFFQFFIHDIDIFIIK